MSKRECYFKAADSQGRPQTEMLRLSIQGLHRPNRRSIIVGIVDIERIATESLDEITFMVRQSLQADGREIDPGGTTKMQMQEASPYQQVLDNIRQLSRGEQLAQIGDIVANLRDSHEYEQDL